ncbi:uncharacterized protein [Blastocystis hominis]|uniref:Pre-rRNA-processing protein Ipi1 N-terminal domain-containing protein n=1 Tax=Blastocystis hominis TaxID=12968 RepID=D8M3C0_BLAHO|nr:uncharacterized protein [Blastocystis hominis]CBK22393.2 unnamed protein product [Blastocystis hominis]|eukprot:XP_012896441.1 uncharacterized protein [Blastocystis hominis]
MVKKGEEDFPKKRKKIGKKNIDPKATNVNVRTKRIRVQEQSIMREESDVVNYRNKSLADLVSQFTHYSANVRKDAVLGLRDLFAQNEILYSTSVNVLITNSIKLLLDSDVGVRQALVSVYSTLLPNVSKSQLSPFADLLNVFINNGLTSINPSIRRSAILMIQVLLNIDPSLFQNSVVKLLSNMVKLTADTKPTILPTRGVLSSSRSQLHSSSKEQRSITDLALETVQRLFNQCLSTSTIYNEFSSWCDRLQDADSEYTQSLHFPLTLSVYKPSMWFHSSDSTSQPTELILPPMKSLLSVLFEAIASLAPSAAPTSSFSNSSKLRSKVIAESSLRKLLLLEELAGDAFLVLEREHAPLNELEKLREWRSLLYDLYPLRLPDSHRNETTNRLVLQQTNELTVLLIAMIDPKGGDTGNEVVHRLLDQDLAFVSSNRHDGEEVRFETVQLRVGVLKRLYERTSEKKTIVEKANRMWSELIEKRLAQSSLPFVVFFRYVVGCHDLSEFGECFDHAVQVLSAVPYSEEKESIAYAIWNNGMSLLLEGVKMKATSLNALKLFQELMKSEVEVASLSLRLQAVAQAILIYSEKRESENEE